MINPTRITYSPTYPSVETHDMHRYWQWQWQYCWGKLLLCSSSCRQICGTPQIDMVSCVRRNCQTRAGVSGDVYKTLECVTKTDSRFSNRVLWMTPKSTSINWVTIWLEQFDFCLNRKEQMRIPNRHIAYCILPPELFLISLSSLQSAVMICPR